MDGHQVDRIEGIDDGVGHVAGETVHVLGDPGRGGEPAILHPADQPPQLLQVLPRLHQTRPPQLERVGAVGEDAVDQLGGRNPVDGGQPSGHARPQTQQEVPVQRVQRLQPGFRSLRPEGLGEMAGQLRERAVGDPHQP